MKGGFQVMLDRSMLNHIQKLEIDGDRQKLSELMRSLYTESLDVLI